MRLKVLISSFRSLEPPSPKKGRVGTPWATIWTHSSIFCSLLKIKQLFQISLCLTRKSTLYSSVVVRRIFCFPLVLAIEARTGFCTCHFNANSWLTLFCTEKMSKGWSFSSIIRTRLLSYICFFLLLVEVEGVVDGSNKDKEGEKEEEERPYFSLPA